MKGVIRMKVEYYKEYSFSLARDMEFKVFGRGGKPVLAVPCQAGRFYDWENFGMVETLREFLETGQLQLFCVDSIDNETLFAPGDPAQRARGQEAYYHYVIDELVPRIQTINGTGRKLLATGCSMGAYHAANFFFRRPDIFDSVIALSGIYDTHEFFGDYMDDLVYANDPCACVRGMPWDHPYRELYANSKIILCVGQGDWEGPLLEGTRRMNAALQQKGIPAWVDYWGHDVSHDWPWWKKQLVYFLPYVLNDIV